MRFHLALAALVPAGCSGKSVEEAETRLAMDTQVTVRAVAPNEPTARRALAAAWEEMDFGIARLNWFRKPSDAWLKGDPEARKDPQQAPSDVWRINADAGKFSSAVDPMVSTCLGAARQVYELSDGAFDPTVGPLVGLWRKAAEENRLPTDDQVAKARDLVGMDKVEIVMAEIARGPDGNPLPPSAAAPGMAEMLNMVGLRKGMSLDLGGIAKGYIAGRMAERMKRAGATAGLVACAGDIFAFGERPRDLALDRADPRWTVAVQDPRYPEDPRRAYTTIRLKDQSVDTSGHYHRGYTIQGRRYSHILDPRTGRPVDTRIASVTVVARDPAMSDGLSTAIAVMGVEKGLALVESLREDGVECLILEAVSEEGAAPGQGEAGPPPLQDVRLIAHRSKGFAALEVTPTK